MPQTQITDRQRYWRDHVLAAAQYEGSIVEYAAANNLKTKDLYQLRVQLVYATHATKRSAGVS